MELPVKLAFRPRRYAMPLHSYSPRTVFCLASGFLLAFSVPVRADLVLDSCNSVTLLETTGFYQVMNCTVTNTGDVDVQVQDVFAWVRPPGVKDPSDRVIHIDGVGKQLDAIIAPNMATTFQYQLFSDLTDAPGGTPDFGVNVVNIILDAESCELEEDVDDTPFCFGGFVKGSDRGGIAIVVDTNQVKVPPSVMKKRAPKRSIRSKDQYDSIVAKVGNRGFVSFNTSPEPSTFVLLSLGGAGVGLLRVRHARVSGKRKRGGLLR